MNTAKKRQYIFGALVVLAALTLIVSTFTLLSRTNIRDVSMDPGATDWTYELISGSAARPASPEIIDDFTVAFTGESCRAVAAKRTLTEKLDGAQLGVYLYDAVCGVDVLVDGEMIYTSFTGAPRDEGGFAVTDGFPPSKSETIEVYLPEDYLGKELTVVTYFTSETTDIIPVFPYLCTVDTPFALTSVEDVLPIFRVTLCAILAFLTSLVYLLDVSNGRADKKVLLLTLFYAMLTVDKAFMSLAGSYSLFTEKLNALDFVCELYIAPLMMFTALSLTSWRRYALASATGLWFIYDFVRLIRCRIIYGPFFAQATAPVILILYLLALTLIILEMKHNKERRPQKSSVILYALIAVTAAICRIIISSAEWGGDIGMYMRQIVLEPFDGYFYPLMLFVTYIFAFTATAAVTIEFVKRTLYTREAINVLATQNRLAMESYRRMADASDATYAARHEMCYLFIGCTNSAPPFKEETKKDRTHGYGLENMKRIAEKYGGVVKLERSDSEFSVKSDLYIGAKNT